jgi:hypothetical protein
MTLVSTEADLLVYQMADETSGEAVVVAVNRGAEPAQAKFAAPAAWKTEVTDALTGEPVPVAATGVEVVVPPRGARILAARPGS